MLSMNKLNLVGQKFSKLTVIEESSSINGRTAWKCQCACGIIKTVKTEHLRDGSTKSCGCWNDEQRSARAENMYSKCIKYSPIEASARHIWRRNYKEMPFEDFYFLSQQNCQYCNEAPSNYQNAAKGKNSSQNVIDNGYFKYNGLDRVDNSLPHSKENCVPCCKWCNYAKRERSIEEFKAWVQQLYSTLIINT
jgi:hypothetical protein